MSDWRRSAACRDYDPELWWPVIGPSVHDKAVAARHVKEAMDVCRRCSVRDDCLRYALENREKEGIWGGTTEYERRPMLRRKVHVWPVVETAETDDEQDYCINGHPWSDENTYHRPKGGRECRACRSASSRERQSTRAQAGAQ